MKPILDLHTHTTASGHAYSTLKENVEAAAKRELKILGTSDHGPEMPGGPHAFYFSNLKVLPREMEGVKILRGAEVNIIDFEGNIDLEKRELDCLDYVIASLHPPCIVCGDMQQNTDAIIKAMKNPKVKIIGHPDDSRFPLDYERLVEAAKDKGVFLEINNSSLRPNSFRAGAWENDEKMLKICIEKEAMIILGSDSHIAQDIGEFSNCLRLLEEVKFPEHLIINCRSEEEILKIFLGE